MDQSYASKLQHSGNMNINLMCRSWLLMTIAEFRI